MWIRPKARFAACAALVVAATLAATLGFVANSTAQSEGDGKTTVLLLGGDAGPQRIGLRTDSINVASIDRSTGRVALFGVPRNLVNTPLPEPYAGLFVCGCWESLINELYLYAEANPDLFGGGPHPGGEVMMATIGHLLGLDIDYFVLVDLPGFVQVIDALGGVTIDVPEQESILLSPAFEQDGWQQYVIPVGRQHLDGRTALAYARTRAESSDYERMARQRCLLGAIAREADPETLLANYPAIVSSVADAVETNIPVDRLPGLIELLDVIDFDTIYSIGFTTPEYMGYYIDQFHPVPDVALISQTVDAVFAAPTFDLETAFGTMPALCSWSG